MLERLLRSRAEVAVLGVVLFSSGLHLREIARRAGVSPPEAKRELDALASLDVLTMRRVGNLSTFSLNPRCAFSGELKGLYVKTEGAVPLLREALAGISGVRYAFVFGSAADGTMGAGSDVDVLAVGPAESPMLEAACFSVQRRTGKEINYILWSESDFRKKVRDGNAFISSILEKPRIWLSGDERDFERNVAAPGSAKSRRR